MAGLMPCGVCPVAWTDELGEHPKVQVRCPVHGHDGMRRYQTLRKGDSNEDYPWYLDRNGAHKPFELKIGMDFGSLKPAGVVLVAEFDYGSLEKKVATQLLPRRWRWVLRFGQRLVLIGEAIERRAYGRAMK